MKFPVKTDVVSVPRNRSGSSAWSVEHKQRVCEGVGQVAEGRSQETLCPLVRVFIGVRALCWPPVQGQDPWGCLLWGGGEFLSHIRFAETEHKLSGLCFILLQTHRFFQGHENVLQQHRKTISHPAPLMRWKQSLVGSRCLLTLALGEMIVVGQKWTCFSDCSFSSLLALWDFLFMDKETAASPASVQRNCNCTSWATLS